MPRSTRPATSWSRDPGSVVVSVAAKLGAFAAVLVASFVLGLGVGRATAPDDAGTTTSTTPSTATTDADGPDHGHDHDEGATP